jgi:hypothetical protein
MVTISFIEYSCFSSCPEWWRRFVTEAGPNPVDSTEVQNRVFEAALKTYNAKIIDSPTGDIDYLTFSDESDFLAFKIRWM